MNTEIVSYNTAQTSEREQQICAQLMNLIATALPDASGKVWHGHPVWFLDENPIVGYSKRKDGISLLFWSGQSFETPGLSEEGKFKAAEISYTDPLQINEKEVALWLAESRIIQWDYKNLVKRKGVLERLL